MNAKGSIIFLAILICVGVYLFHFVIPDAERRIREGFPFQGIELSSIEITDQKGTQKYVKDEQGWKFKGFGGSAVDSEKVEELARSVSVFRVDTLVPKEELEEDLSPYGLSEPAYKVAVVVDGQSKSISIGAENKFLGLRYHQFLPDGDVFLASSSIFEVVKNGEIYFRKKTILDVPDSIIEKIVFKGQQGNLAFYQKDPLDWWFSDPIEADADDEEISKVLRTLRTIEADKYFDPQTEEPLELEPFGLDNPDLEVELNIAGQNPEKIELIFKAFTIKDDYRGMFVSQKGTGSVIGFEQSIIEGFPLKIGNFREKRPFRIPLDQIIRISFESGGKLLQLQRKGEREWLVDGEEGDPVFIEQLLAALSEVEAKEFLPGSGDFGFSAPLLKVVATVETASGESTRTLIVGDRFEGESSEPLHYASAGGYFGAFTVGRRSIRKIFPQKEVLLKVDEQYVAPLIPEKPKLRIGSGGQQ